MALNATTFPKVVTVLDSSISSSTSIFAVHALSSSSTVFLSGKDLVSYLRSLEVGDVRVQEVDFQTLKNEPAAPAAPPTATKSKDKAPSKAEAPIQIAIGAKKDEDFSAWYTDVNSLRIFSISAREAYLKRSQGSNKGRYVRLLQRQWMLYFETLVLWYLGGHSKCVFSCICFFLA
jgi:hypothetical protein